MLISQRQVSLAASALMFVVSAAIPEAKADLSALYTTGEGATAGSADLHYSLVSAPGGFTTAFVVSPSNNAANWVVTNTGGPLWLSPVSIAVNSSLPTGYISGNYTPYDYRTTFASSAGGTYTFSVTFAADDSLSIKLNGATEKTANPGTEYDYTSLTTFSFTDHVVSGTNTLDFLVYNTGNPAAITDGGPSGLLVTDLTAIAVPEPSTIWVALFGGAAGITVSLRRRKLPAA
jgi:PEP-CTERM motif